MTAKEYEDIINKLKEENVELRVRLNDVNEECILLDKENGDLKKYIQDVRDDETLQAECEASNDLWYNR